MVKGYQMIQLPTRQSFGKSFGSEKGLNEKSLYCLNNKSLNCGDRPGYGSKDTMLRQLSTSQNTQKPELFYKVDKNLLKESGLPTDVVLFLIHLESLSNDKDNLGWYSYASNDHIAIELNKSKRTIERYFTITERKGFLFRMTQKKHDEITGQWRAHRRVYVQRAQSKRNALTGTFDRPPFQRGIKDKQSNKKLNTHNLNISSLNRKPRKRMLPKKLENDVRREGIKEEKTLMKKDNSSITLNKETLEFDGVTEKDREVWKKKCPSYEKELDSASLFLMDESNKAKWPKSYLAGKSLRSFLGNCMVSRKHASSENMTYERNSRVIKGLNTERVRHLKKKYPKADFDRTVTRMMKWIDTVQKDGIHFVDKTIETFLKNAQKDEDKIRENDKITLGKIREAAEYFSNFKLKCTVTDSMSSIEFEGERFGNKVYEQLLLEDVEKGKLCYNIIGILIRCGIPLADCNKIVRDHVIPEYRISEYEKQEILHKERLKRDRERNKKNIIY